MPPIFKRHRSHSDQPVKTEPPSPTNDVVEVPPPPQRPRSAEAYLLPTVHSVSCKTCKVGCITSQCICCKAGVLCGPSCKCVNCRNTAKPQTNSTMIQQFNRMNVSGRHATM